MPDLNSDALGIWEHLKPAIDKEIEQKTRGMVQRRKMKVTTAPSISTGTIGVTEAFGTTEMVIPFATNLISATVGDMVWVEFMYGATNAFASMFASADEKDWDVAGDLSVGGNAGISGNLDVSGSTSLQNTTVNGVLDMTKRRCNAVLSSAGWYRILRYDAPSSDAASGVLPFEIEFFIGRVTNTTTNELHKVTLFAAQNYIRFNNELSQSQTFSIDKVRAMVSGSTLYVDIHYAGNSANVVYVDFSVRCWWEYMGLFAPVAFESVDPSPSGETVFTEYMFSANGTGGLTVNGVLDVTPRRCYERLSSEGWYRVMKLAGINIYEAEGAGGFIVDFNITRNVDTINNEAHKISLMATWGNIKFINEQSFSNVLGITKIRTTYSGSNLFVDVYYGLSTGNTVTVAFNVTCQGGNEGKFASQPFTGVDPSPAGETVLSEYTFIKTTGERYGFTPSHGTSAFGGCWYSRNGEYVTVHVGLTDITANTNHIIGTLPVGYRPVSQCCASGSSQTYEQQAHLYVRENGNIDIWSPNTMASLDATFMWR